MAGSPWTNQVVDLIILTEESTGFSGLFGYSPAAGAGNLILSVSASSGTDPYGNAFVAGLSSYEGSTYTSIEGGQAQLSAAGEFEAAQIGAGGAGDLFLSSGLASNADVKAQVLIDSQTSAGGTATITLSAALVNVIVNMTVQGSLTVDGSLVVDSGASITGGLTVDTINGSSSTGAGDNGGVTSGPSGTVNAFPAAGPNHTHAEFHHHPI